MPPFDFRNFALKPQNDPTLDELLAQLGIGQPQPTPQGGGAAPSGLSAPSISGASYDAPRPGAEPPQPFGFGAPSVGRSSSSDQISSLVSGAAGGGESAPAPYRGMGPGEGDGDPLSTPSQTARLVGSGTTVGQGDASPSSGRAGASFSIPTWAPRGKFGDVLDTIFLNGALQTHAANERQHQLDNITQQRLADVWSNLTPAQRAAYAANPAEFGKAMADNFATHTVAGGSSLVPGAGMPGRGADGGAYTAPLMGNDNGRLFTQTPGRSTITGFTGPKVGANGVDERTGRQFPVASTVPIPAGSTPFGVVTAGNAQPQLPQIGGDGLDDLGGGSTAAQPAPGSPAARIAALAGPAARPAFPSPAQIIAALPGMKINSGFRDPSHNADMGGVPGSFHTRGSPNAPQAYDLAPLPGKTVDQTAAIFRKTFPGVHVLPEVLRNHVHVDAKGLQGAGGMTPAFAPPPASTGFSGGSAIPLAQPRSPQLLQPGDPRLTKFAPGAAVEQQADGSLKPMEGTGYSPATLNEIYTRNTKDLASYTDAVPLVRAARQASKAQSGASDISLIEAAARLFNPRAAVRQGSMKMFFDETQGIPDTIQGALAQLHPGDANAKLTPTTRGAIMDMVEQRAAILRQSAEPVIRAQQQFATRNKINPGDILPPIEEVGPAPRSGGAVVTLNPKNPNADFARLQKGDQYRGPDGIVRTK